MMVMKMCYVGEKLDVWSSTLSPETIEQPGEWQQNVAAIKLTKFREVLAKLDVHHSGRALNLL